MEQNDAGIKATGKLDTGTIQVTLGYDLVFWQKRYQAQKRLLLYNTIML
jgi:hypothetical protein